MANSSDFNSVSTNETESESNVSPTSRIVDVHPLAFTIEFNDQKVDEARKSKVQERLSAFTLKHRRNPSLPDFGSVKNSKGSPPIEKVTSPLNSQHVPIINKKNLKSGKLSENQWKSSTLKAVKSTDLQTPLILRNLEINGVRDNLLKHLKNGRRNSLNDIDSKVSCQNSLPNNGDYKGCKNNLGDKNDDSENKSDTVSEAGTYTVDKEDGSLENGEKTHLIEDENHEENVRNTKKNYQSSWINDWVRDVEQQNLRNPALQEPPIISRNSGSGHSSPGASKIPSPINTINRKAKQRSIKGGEEKQFPVKLNGSLLNRFSSSLSGKDYGEKQNNEGNLETESFLRTTESVVTAMQNRMKLAFDGRNSDVRKGNKRDFNYKERPHPPSTASDTDTNSETDTKTFKKPMGNPFTSARLNRAFSLRRAKAEPDEFVKKKGGVVGNKEMEIKNSTTNMRSSPSPKPVISKPPSSSPFSRTDCGRFSMRSTVSNLKSSLTSQSQKKDAKKSSANNRSASSLSSREVEFQNWRRRKSFDPMKAAAEGRKKELAKKAALNQSMTQSVNLGNGIRNRRNSNSNNNSNNNNSVLRSASFHSTAQVFDAENDDREEFQDQGSTDEQEESGTLSWVSNHRSLPYNSPTRAYEKSTLNAQTPIFSSRCSLISEAHSSPSRRAHDLDNLVMTAINDLSYKLKIKSCNLLKKLNYLYDPNEEKSFKLRDEIAVLESRQNYPANSPIHHAASRNLSTILKNLKGLENVLKVLDDVLFDENLEIYINE